MGLISKNDMSRFSDAISYVMNKESSWMEFSLGERIYQMNESFCVLIDGLMDKQEPEEAFSNAVFRLLKEIGYKGPRISELWFEIIEHCFSNLRAKQKAD